VLQEPAPVGEHLSTRAPIRCGPRFLEPSHKEVVAASAPAVDAGDGKASYLLQGAPVFSLSVSESSSPAAPTPGASPSTSYYFDGHQAAGAQGCRDGGRSRPALFTRFAPYPYKPERRRERLGGRMEADGLFFMAGISTTPYDGA